MIRILILPLLAIAAPAVAGTITWEAVLDSTGPANISTAGTLKYSRNVNGSTQTVNGVTFTGGSPIGWTQGGVTTGLNTTDTGDAGYNALLNTSVASGGGSPGNPSLVGAIRLDSVVAGGLITGRTYQIQIWYTDQRTGTAALNDRKMRVNSAGGGTITVTSGNTDPLQISGIETPGTLPAGVTLGSASGDLEADPDNLSGTGSGDAKFGSFVTGTWTADGTPLYLLVQGFPVPGQNTRPALNAFQIRELPSAPATPDWVSTSRDAGTAEWTLTFTTESTATYSLWGGTDIAALTELIPGIAGTGAPVTQLHTPPGSPPRWFYQVRKNSAGL